VCVCIRRRGVVFVANTRQSVPPHPSRVDYRVSAADSILHSSCTFGEYLFSLSLSPFPFIVVQKPKATFWTAASRQPISSCDMAPLRRRIRIPNTYAEARYLKRCLKWGLKLAAIHEQTAMLRPSRATFPTWRFIRRRFPISLSLSLSLSLSPSLSPPLSLSLSRPFRGNSMWDGPTQRRIPTTTLLSSSDSRFLARSSDSNFPSARFILARRRRPAVRVFVAMLVPARIFHARLATPSRSPPVARATSNTCSRRWSKKLFDRVARPSKVERAIARRNGRRRGEKPVHWLCRGIPRVSDSRRSAAANTRVSELDSNRAWSRARVATSRQSRATSERWLGNRADHRRGCNNRVEQSAAMSWY